MLALSHTRIHGLPHVAKARHPSQHVVGFLVSVAQLRVAEGLGFNFTVANAARKDLAPITVATDCDIVL